MPPARIRIFPILFCVTLAGAGVAGKAWSATTLHSAVSVSAWEEEGESDAQGSLYLQLGSSGQLGRFRLDMDGYGRASVAREDAQAEEGDLGRIYNMLLTASTEGQSSVAVGRQQVSVPTGPAFFDGLRLQAGQAFRIDGRWGLVAHPAEDDSRDATYLGVGLQTDLARGMVLGLDYARTSTSDSLLTELLAADWYYSWFRYTKAYIRFNYDLMSETLHETVMGSRLFFSDSFTLQLEYNQSVSLFDSDSIYSVFAVDAAEATSFAMLFTPSRNLRYTWEYALESYQEGSGGRRYGVSGAWSSERMQIDLGLEQHKGFGGSLTEITTGLFARPLPSLRLGVSGEFDRTQNTGEETISSYAARLSTVWSPTAGTRLTLNLEQSQDDLDEEPARCARVALSMEL